jgi:YHS domain-containing protein
VIRVILIALLLILVARAFWSVVDGIIEAAGGGGSSPRRRHRQQRGPAAPAVKLARDPICGTHVPTDGSVSLTTRGETYYFCSEACRNAFQQRG